MRSLKTKLLSLAMIALAAVASAQDVKTEAVTTIPAEIASDLLGIRVYQEKAFVMANSGKYIVVDLNNGNVMSHKLDVADMADYDVVAGKIIYLDKQGMIGGHCFHKWSKGPYEALRIDACDQGAVLSGGSSAYFLNRNATATFEIRDMSFVLPIEKGFAWSMSVGDDKRWEANLYDLYGNMMSKVYKFSEYFEPSNVEIGPENSDGDLLVSATEDNARTLALIGNNGRMFWKLNVSRKLCPRDVAFDNKNKLLLLEKSEKGEVVLDRLTFTVPEG